MYHHVVNRSIEDIYWLMVISVMVPKVTKYHLCQERSDILSTSIQHMYSFNLFFGVLENDAWLDHVMTCSRSFVIPIFRTYISYRIDRLPNDWHFKTMFNYYI